jgi:transposase
MDFDHVRGEKRFSISKMVGRKRLDVLKEIEKCDVVCVLCHRTRTHNRKSHPAPATEKQAKRSQKRFEIKKTIEILKAAPCLDCSKTFHPWQMDFDHRPGTEKVGSIAFLLGSMNKDKVLAEIAKCDLVCALCHRHRTHVRGEYSKSTRPVAKSDGREAWRVNYSIREQDKDVAVQMYLAGKTAKDVAKFCGVTDPVVRKLLDDRGIQRRGRDHGPQKLLPEQQKQAISLYADGLAARVIGERFGVSEDVVRLCLKRHGVERRRRSDLVYNRKAA